MIGWWQHLPEHIDPIVFSLGGISVRWYAICFALGIGVMWFRFSLDRKGSFRNIRRKTLEDIFFFVLIGAFVGARLGYVFWYAPAYFLEHPSRILLPFDPVTGRFTGIAGLSFHGALVGAGAVMLWWARIRRESFFVWTDRFARIVPLGILFGRLGNFLNGELWGRTTDMAWGMFFPQVGAMVQRHPSQLYEALGEGALLYGILSWIDRKKHRPGFLTACFLFGYGVIRFILEYWREPDVQIGLIADVFSLGQIFSLGLILFGGAWLWYMATRKAPEKICYNGTAFKERKS